MIFRETELAGAYEISIDPVHDHRGFFARTWCRSEFEQHGLCSDIAQCSISFNVQRGTLRGIHYQDMPYPESKMVRCTRGAIFDVVVDLRRESSTFKRWIAIELTAENHKMAYIPPGCAHGFITLEENTEVCYQISEFYRPELSRGVRWNDPALGIKWPIRPIIISERDECYPDLIQ